MNRILDLNSVQGIVTLEAGVILQSLSDYLDKEGFIVPLDLGAKGSCQLGGNISTNAGGLRYVRYGSLHGSVLGLEAVLADGTVVDALSTLRKDNTGYDVKQLFIGSEGSLGVVTKATMLVPRKPAAVHVLYLALPSYDAVLKAMAAAKDALGEILSAIEFQDACSLELVLKHQGLKPPFDGESAKSPFFLLVETSGSVADHDQDKLCRFCELLEEAVPGAEPLMATSEAHAAELWRLRESVAESAGRAGRVYKYDVSLPVAKMWELTEATRARLEGTDSVTMGYGHLGDGNLHINVVAAPGRGAEVLSMLEPWLFEQLAAVGGSISAEHGLGQAKNEFIHFSKPPAAVALMRALKEAMDPKGILNPYKVLPNKK
jgi:D-2-hydroxyglutarate dehydrogenase